MPRVNGLDVLRRIKQSEELKDTHVIMLTTTYNYNEIELCYRLGCSAYIAKPIRYSYYVEAMRKAGLFPSVVANGVRLKSKCPA